MSKRAMDSAQRANAIQDERDRLIINESIGRHVREKRLEMEVERLEGALYAEQEENERLRAKVTEMQTACTREVERRRKAEAK